MTAQVKSDHHGNSETDLEGVLSLHQELRTEIDTMHRNFENLVASGQNLLTGQHYAVEMIQERLEDLRTSWSELLESWEDRTDELRRRKEAENMNREVTQLEAWLLNQEAELSPNEFGSCLENVEDLLKKHDEIERMLLAQEERFLGLIQPLDDEQCYNVVTEDLPNKENDTSAVSDVHDLTSFASDHVSLSANHDTLAISKPSESKVLKSPDENGNDLTDTPLPSELGSVPKQSQHSEDLLEDFLTSNNYETAEIEPESFRLQDDKIEGNVVQSDRLLELHSAALNWIVDPDDDETASIRDASATVDEMPISIENNPTKDRVPDHHDGSETSELQIEMETEKVDDRVAGGLHEYRLSSTANIQDSPELQSMKHLFKEPSAASQRILDISPLCAGVLQRKQETDFSGQRSVAQPWRSYYTVLSEDILQFFKDLEGFKSKWHVSKPMSLVGAFCEELMKSSRQGNIFRVVFRNKSEYLFAAESEEECKLWVVKINSVIRTAAGFGSPGDGYHGDAGDHLGDDNHGNHLIGDTGDQLRDGDGKVGDTGDHPRDGDSSHGDNGVHEVDGVSDSDVDNFHCCNSDDSDQDYRDGFSNYTNDIHDYDDDGRNDIDGMKSDNEKLPSSDPKQSLSNSHAPTIVITDTSSNDEFLVEDEMLTPDTRSYSDEDAQLSDGDILLFDGDTISLPEQSDYELPSWYPTRSSDVLDHNDTYPVPGYEGKPDRQIYRQDVSEVDNAPCKTTEKGHRGVPQGSFERPPSHSNSSSPSLPDEDTIAPPPKLTTRVFIAQDKNGHGPPPPVPSTPPPSIPVSDMDLPPDLPETLPPPSDDILEMLDFIPPPVLDPSFDFLMETEDKVGVYVVHHEGKFFC